MTVYFLWLVEAMVGGNGFESFLHHASARADVTGVLRAFRDGGCERLEQRYREALDVAASEGAEFLMCVDEDWLRRERRRFPLDAPWKTIDSHDEGGSWWLLARELRPAFDRYIDTHRDELVAMHRHGSAKLDPGGTPICRRTRST
jgi:hypothetical protein